MKMLKKIILVGLILCMAACSKPDIKEINQKYQQAQTMSLNGDSAIYDKVLGRYLIEEGASLRLAVDDDNYGKAIVDLWDRTHPNFKGLVKVENVQSDSVIRLLQENQAGQADVLMVEDRDAIIHSTKFLALETALKDLVLRHSPKDFVSAGNPADTLVYVPMAMQGTSFIYNKTLMTKLGLDLTDANGDNVIDAFDSWEKIFDLAKHFYDNPVMVDSYSLEEDENDPTGYVVTDKPVQRPFTVMFPLSIHDPIYAYHWFSYGFNQLFDQEDSTDPGYTLQRLQPGFDFLLSARDNFVCTNSDHQICESNQMTWTYQNGVRGLNTVIFSMVDSSYDLDSYEDITGNTYAVAAFPSYQNKPQTGLAWSKGFVINSFSRYRSAAMELVRLIYSDEGMELLAQHSKYLPLTLLDRKQPLLTDDRKNQYAKAFANHQVRNNRLIKGGQEPAFDLLYQKILPKIAPEVWDGNLTVEEAVVQMKKMADDVVKELREKKK